MLALSSPVACSSLQIFSNIWNFFYKLATAYGMINVSDLKQVPVTAEAGTIMSLISFHHRHAAHPHTYSPLHHLHPPLASLPLHVEP